MREKQLKSPWIIFKESWEILKKHPSDYYKVLGLSILTVLGIFLVSGLVGVTLSSLGASPIALILLGVVLLIPVSIYLQSWFSLALVHTLLANSDGTSVPAKVSLKETREYTLSFVWLKIISGLIFVFSFILLIFPVFIVSIWFSLATYIFLVEKKKGIQALMTAREYARGYTLSLAFYFLVFLFITPILSGIITFISKQIGAPFVGNLFNFIIEFIFLPLGTLYGIGVYKEIKRVKGKVTVKNYEKRKWKYILSAILGLVLPIAFGLLFLQFISRVLQNSMVY